MSRSFARPYWGRRRIISAMAVAGAGIGSAAFLAACGGGTNQETSTSSAPGSSTDATQPKSGGTFNVPTTYDPPDFDPTIQYTVSVHDTVGLAYNRLLRWKWGSDIGPATTEIVPDLASAWEQPDPTTYTFKLPTNIKWHNRPPVNGRTLTSDDVKKTIERILDPAYKSQLAGDFGDIQSVETPDATTVIAKLAQPNAEMPNIFAFHNSWIVPAELTTGEQLKSTMIGTGPFLFEKLDKGRSVSFVRNPEYWRGPEKPYLAGVTRQIIPTTPAQVSAFVAGQLHTIDTLTARDADAIKVQVRGAQQLEYANWTTRRLQITPTRPPLNDPRVRLAILKLVDQREIIDRVYRRGFFVGPIPWNFGSFGMPEEEAKKLLKVDVPEAKKLLDAAGYDFDQTLELAWTPQYGSEYEPVALVVQSNLQKAGIKTQITNYPYAEFIARWRPPFDKNQLIVGPLNSPSPDLLYTAYNPKGRFYFQPITDQKLIDYTVQQRRLIDPKQREALTQEAQRYLLTENVIDVPLGLPALYVFTQPSVRNYQFHVTFAKPFLDETWLAS